MSDTIEITDRVFVDVSPVHLPVGIIERRDAGLALELQPDGNREHARYVFMEICENWDILRLGFLADLATYYAGEYRQGLETFRYRHELVCVIQPYFTPDHVYMEASHTLNQLLGRIEKRDKWIREQITELRSMPYQKYLQSDHWKRTRNKMRELAGNRCQVCNTNRKPLNVHHRTYERIGNERYSDLIVLCKDCHQLFHENGEVQS